MAIVWPTALGVEQYAAAGRNIDVPRLGCPGCKEPMSYWGWYQRDLRVGRSQALLVRRQRCRPCATSHAVLPSFMAHGRLDAIGVIGPALEAMVDGHARPGRRRPGPALYDGAGLATAFCRPGRDVGCRRRPGLCGSRRAGAPAQRGSPRRWRSGRCARHGGRRGGALARAWAACGASPTGWSAGTCSPPTYIRPGQRPESGFGCLLGVPRAGNAANKEAFMANDHHDKAEELALFRYRVISEAASPRLSPAERGRLARELAARTWVTPEGTERQVSRTSIDRWLAAYAKDGLAGLAPVPRSDRGRPRAGAPVAGRSSQAAPGRAGALVGPDRRHNRPGARGMALRAHRPRAPAPPRPVPPGTVGRPGPCVRPLRGGPAQRDLDRRRPARAFRPLPTRARAPSGPSSSCSSTTTAACSCTGAG